ncbi:glutathione S-transferase, partial [Mycena galericulata]
RFAEVTRPFDAFDIFGDGITAALRFKKIEFSKNEQKEPWFIKLNPNGRIPVIVDRARDDFVVFETGAILLYLQQYYDKEGKFGFDAVKQPNETSEVLQWIFWANGGFQLTSTAGHFLNAKEKIPYAQGRYVDETKRLFGVLEIRLQDQNREYLVGDKLTIADINAYPWVAGHKLCGVETLDEWPALKSWFDKIAARDATKAGYTIP